MAAKHILAVVAIIALATTFALPAQQVVICKDGRRLSGDVTEIKDGYQIRMKGGTVIISDDQVLKIEDVVTAKDELAKRLKKVDSKDAEGHYQLAKWAYDQNLFSEAEEILRKVLKLDPNHEGAPLLLKLAKIGIAESKIEESTTDDGSTVKGSQGDNPPAVEPSELLKKEDIYKIRLLELTSDDRVSIKYRNDVLERFIKSRQGLGRFQEPNYDRKFRKYSKVKQVLEMIEDTDRENSSIRDDILINSDPKVIKEFKSRVWPIIARSYGSANCYGGVKGRDGLKLFNMPLSDERVVYTNFYILHAWERGGRKMIDRDKPEMSLLLQYGLPRKLAKVPAPDYITESIFTSKDDRNYKVIANWIASLRNPFLSPGYRIEYNLPGEKATEPTPTPETQPAEVEEDSNP